MRRFEFIEILEEHIPLDLGISKNHFKSTCFGSKKINDTVILSKLTEDVLLKSKGKKALKEDFFKIAFFDMLFANEDRHLNNYNLLFTLVQNEYVLYPIDHEACFNHQNLNRPLVVLTYEETLVYSTLFNKLFNNIELSDKDILAQRKEKYYLCYRKCVERIEEIVSNTPRSWSISNDQISKDLRIFLSDDWFESCWKEFLIYIQLFISNTQ